MSSFTRVPSPSDAAVSTHVVHELTPATAMIVSHSGVALPPLGALADSTTTSRDPVPPRISSTARRMVAGTTAPAPFMVNAGPDQLERTTSAALPSLVRVVWASADGDRANNVPNTRTRT